MARLIDAGQQRGFEALVIPQIALDGCRRAGNALLPHTDVHLLQKPGPEVKAPTRRDYKTVARRHRKQRAAYSQGTSPNIFMPNCYWARRIVSAAAEAEELQDRIAELEKAPVEYRGVCTERTTYKARSLIPVPTADYDPMRSLN